MFGVAWAMGTGGGGQAPQGGMATVAQFIPLILIGFVFYFMLIRPQQKKQKETQGMLNSLKKGDKVVTTGGIHGEIVILTDEIATLKLKDNNKIDFSRSSIVRVKSKK
ncbi:MAG: preprotein translocase subunit YajC [bacterium]